MGKYCIGLIPYVPAPYSQGLYGPSQADDESKVISDTHCCVLI